MCTAAGSPRCSPDRGVRAHGDKQASVQREMDGSFPSSGVREAIQSKGEIKFRKTVLWITFSKPYKGVLIKQQ